MNDDVERIDFTHVTCNLFPALATHLAATSADIVEFALCKGKSREMVLGFAEGTGWTMEFVEGKDKDVARFRRAKDKPAPPLNIVEY